VLSVSLPASLFKCLRCMKRTYIIRKRLYLTTINLWSQYDSYTVHTVLFYKNGMVFSFVKLWQYLLHNWRPSVIRRHWRVMSTVCCCTSFIRRHFINKRIHFWKWVCHLVHVAYPNLGVRFTWKVSAWKVFILSTWWLFLERHQAEACLVWNYILDVTQSNIMKTIGSVYLWCTLE
jgi:hypothetical protein